MKLLVLFSIFLLFVIVNSERCLTTQEDCENMTSEYEKYRECMERRTKRSVDCQDSDYNCDKCDCNTCSYNSCASCGNENNCCETCCQRSACRSATCCQQTCRAECKSHSCRTSCKRRCQDRYTDDGSSSSSTKFQTQTKNQHNITTVIHLNNVINNTNLINLPITLNNTVFNNITNRGGSSLTSSGGGGSSDNCCLTIGPRQCIPQSTFPFMRCFHIRKRACGNICLAPVVHYQTHEICDNNVNLQQPCHQQVVYIPQPQPRCAYQNSWPYVNCGNQQLQSCEGCYNHYVKREDVTKCSSFCYDDGYGVGPYYRQGPFYRPGFAHAASCLQTGLCGFEGYGYEGAYGGYEGLPENGFPFMYPPQTYPFIVEDCKNCTYRNEWDGPNLTEPIQYPGYKNLVAPIEWTKGSDQIMKIDASVNTARNERYAEIKIKPEKKSKELTATVIPEKLMSESTTNRE